MSQSEAIKKVLSDGQWHPYSDLEQVAGRRYHSALFDLGKRVRVERRQKEVGHGKEYRLAGPTLGTVVESARAVNVAIKRKNGHNGHAELISTAAMITGESVDEFIKQAAQHHAEAIIATARKAVLNSN